LPLGNCIGVKCDETIPTVKRDWFGDDEHKVTAFRPRLPEERKCCQQDVEIGF
jgi:hypothetical protein